MLESKDLNDVDLHAQTLENMFGNATILPLKESLARSNNGMIFPSKKESSARSRNDMTLVGDEITMSEDYLTELGWVSIASLNQSFKLNKLKRDSEQEPIQGTLERIEWLLHQNLPKVILQELLLLRQEQVLVLEPQELLRRQLQAEPLESRHETLPGGALGSGHETLPGGALGSRHETLQGLGGVLSTCVATSQQNVGISPPLEGLFRLPIPEHMEWFLHQNLSDSSSSQINSSLSDDKLREIQKHLHMRRRALSSLHP